MDSKDGTQSESQIRSSELVSLSHGERLMLYRAIKDRAYQLKVMYHTIDDANLRQAIWNEMERMESRASELSQAKANNQAQRPERE